MFLTAPTARPFPEKSGLSMNSSCRLSWTWENEVKQLELDLATNKETSFERPALDAYTLGKALLRGISPAAQRGNIHPSDLAGTAVKPGAISK